MQHMFLLRFLFEWCLLSLLFRGFPFAMEWNMKPMAEKVSEGGWMTLSGKGSAAAFIMFIYFALEL